MSLAAFLGEFEDPAFKAGNVAAAPQENGVLQMAYAEYSPAVERFHQAAYRHGWVLDFDWPKWAVSCEAEQLRDDKTVLRKATPEQLMKLLTVCIRGERFAEGSLLDAFHSGLILGIVQRAADLAAD